MITTTHALKVIIQTKLNEKLIIIPIIVKIAKIITVVDGNEKQEYEMHVKFLKTNEDQSDNMNKTFSSKINIVSSSDRNSGEEFYKEKIIKDVEDFINE